MSDRDLEHVRIYPLDTPATGDLDVESPGDVETAGLRHGRGDLDQTFADTGERDDGELRQEPDINPDDIVDLEEGKDGVFGVSDKDSSGKGGPAHGGRGRGGRDGGRNGRSELWKPRGSGGKPPRGQRAILSTILAAGVAGAAVSVTGATVAAEDLFSGSGSSAGAPPAAESGPLQRAVQPEAEHLAARAIKLTLHGRDGFRATQVGPNEVDLQTGGDSFQDGITFTQPQAGFVDVKLVAPGIDAADLNAGDAADVAQVFAEETEAVPNSGGSAEDTQVVLADPSMSQSRDGNDLFYGGNGGEQWSGIYGTDRDNTTGGYVGYSSDPNAILTGPGPDEGHPMFDAGYWGGGTPPQTYANNGNASQVQTAKDAAAEAPKVFSGALRDIVNK